MKKIYLISILIIILIIIGAGIWFMSNDQSLNKQNIGLANPASVFCIDNGGRSEIRTDSSGGQVGFCVFEDNTKCDEWAYFRNECKPGEQSDNQIACTQEAKQCPDGSYVGRTGPNCEFSLCPLVSTSKKSGITGIVTLSPTCPVERIPPDPKCAPKFYSTSINIIKIGSTGIVKTIQSDSKGTFSVDLNPGAYVLKTQGGNILPTCREVSVEVKSGQYTTTEISCDTGIR